MGPIIRPGIFHQVTWNLREAAAARLQLLLHVSEQEKLKQQRHAPGWMDGWMDGWTDGRMDGWTDGRMDGWTDGWTDGRMDGWMDGWVLLLGNCGIVDGRNSAPPGMYSINRVNNWLTYLSTGAGFLQATVAFVLRTSLVKMSFVRDFLVMKMLLEVDKDAR